MPTISNRGANAHTSPIRKLSPYADAAKKAGKKVYHLNIGQPDLPTPPAALQAIKNTDIKVLAYSPSNGLPSYRSKLPVYYRRYGIEVVADDILVTSGASEGIYFSLLACLDEGETVLAPEPLYANYVGFAEMAGVQIKPVTSAIENGFALPSIAEFHKTLTPDVRAILLCNPNNPTGAVYPEKMLRALAELALERDIFLLIDEVYREFCYGDIPFFSALNLPGMEKNVVVFDSVSKRYSACGARVGAVVSRNHDVLATILKYAETRLSPPTFGQILSEALIDTGEEYFSVVKEEYRRRRDLLFRRLSDMPGVACYLPEGAFYVFAKLPIDDCERFCQWLLEDFSLNNETVMLAPGNGFYATPGLGKQEVRFAYVLNETDLDKAMDCLAEALKQYKGVMEPGKFAKID
ncbi:MAG: pyridoxal phosphate-dependent aminotransferase [Saprospiraceae bacterium]|nr:pyridoxal phosphate-dependent aminotransferase [Saprospiraceae bacterium]